ncbi:glutamine--tRNA ligase/YqeY domain fusion protein [Pumilibacter intestinalis]|uniref:glutamine--tRNA ligase/YqeY domain fusion protein n=1 Tax=Pumilibacter intestinalis TaxID=2941511 RepID=UPI00203F7F13|nr:glutamine--tRNA ligase/YqeY domain fusion protein [Pumilibacter intestinalis]
MANFIEEIIEADLAHGRETEITTRFPPEPNGYLHIGHAKAICLNVGLARKYGGKCNLRFDDTNPVKEEDEYVQSIIEDARWLGWDGEIFFASDYFEVMYRAAVTLIERGKAYIDDISPEDMKKMRGTLTEPGVESKYRNRPVAESLALFEDMRAGKIADGALVLRAKIDMASPNINMRDPIIYRVLKARHHRQGDKWCVYPMYDFAHPIEDAVENISHSVCTLEFEDHRPLYDWVLRECGDMFPHPPHQYEFARLNIERMIMSKRYLKKLVDEGFVSGWDDPRMPTIAGLRRRGYTPASIREFCERIGVAKANSEVEVGQLESCIREELNATAPRAMAVLDPLELVLDNVPEDFCEKLDFEINQFEPDKGSRTIELTKHIFIERGDFEVVPPPKYKRLTPGGTVRLKSGYIIKCTGYDGTPENVERVHAEIIEGTRSGEDNSGIKVKGVIHWVNCKAVKAELRLYDYLLIADDTAPDFNDRLNPESLVVKHGYAEEYLASAKKGDSYQFMRQGYFCRDSKEDGLVFNRIVGLKDAYNKKK